MRIDRVKLIAEMARQDMTVYKLAEITGISRATITGIRGGKKCYDSIGNSIANALGVNAQDLKED